METNFYWFQIPTLKQDGGVGKQKVLTYPFPLKLFRCHIVSYIAREYSRHSLLLATRDVSPGGTSAPQCCVLL